MWYRRRRQKARRTSVTKHYLEHKEAARELVMVRLNHYNQFYGFSWNRVAIRNQKTCWGSCSELRNLNFSYRLLFLPKELCDYIIVHELCHLKHLHHGPEFWDEIGKVMEDWHERKTALHALERSGMKSLK